MVWRQEQGLSLQEGRGASECGIGRRQAEAGGGGVKEAHNGPASELRLGCNQLPLTSNREIDHAGIQREVLGCMLQVHLRARWRWWTAGRLHSTTMESPSRLNRPDAEAGRCIACPPSRCTGESPYTRPPPPPRPTCEITPLLPLLVCSWRTRGPFMSSRNCAFRPQKAQ